MQEDNRRVKAQTPFCEENEKKVEPQVSERESTIELEERLVPGRVVECFKLNVRSTPVIDATNSNVVEIIECLDRVMVCLDASTDDFYKVRTESGLEGFCLKKHIVLPQKQ